ncbi:hypothetical protein [Telluribacter humicola]|uniref:hypothetical protein n=1 Tax=Telluribacter humicola TaxID=1720261 RepID=UPI001A9658B7|nr:hypothetical protein [Telluribacter humicola]
MTNQNRLLPPHTLPETLWDQANGVIELSPILKKAYLETLSENNLEHLSLSRGANDSPIGGISQEETDEHFARSFDGSSARVQLALIDPNYDINGASDALINSLSGNRLVIVDAPCGAGAASLSLLTTIAELRSKQVLPRIPLEVVFIGGEIAEPARRYAQIMVDKVTPELEKQAIFLKTEFRSWDATSDISTTDLIKAVVRAESTKSKLLVLIANFSGFLEKKMKDAEPQIRELLRYSAGQNSSAIWIEPQRNSVTKQGGLFSKIETLALRFARFIQLYKTNSDTENHAKASSKYRRPIKSQDTVRVNLAVISLVLKKPYAK